MNRLQEVVQRFRSGSADSDKVPFNLEVDESRTRSFSTNESDSIKNASPTTGRKSDMESLKLALSRTAVLQAHQLHNSMLPATTDSSIPQRDRKVNKRKPKGTFEYTVQDGDTLVKIGARFDVTPSELIKANKLLSRTVFVGQTLFVPDSSYANSDSSTPTSASPVPHTSPHVTVSVISLPTAPYHVAEPLSLAEPVKATTELPTDPQLQNSTVEDETDKKELQKFLKMPVRRVLDEEEKATAAEGFTVKGTLLVTPIAIMFDPDVSDPLVIKEEDQQKYSVVVYMEEVRSAALFHDISPRMFWKQPKELRSHSPKPKPYRSGQGNSSKVEGYCGKHDEQKCESSPGNIDLDRFSADGSHFDGECGQQKGSFHEGNAVVESAGGTGSISEDLGHKDEVCGLVPSSGEVHHSRMSEEIQHTPSSLTSKQTSHSSDQEVSQMYQQQNSAKELAETQEFRPHISGSPSNAQMQILGAPSRASGSSPVDVSGRLIFLDHTDSIDDNPSMQTQGFEPVHFTDMSPNSMTAHPRLDHRQGVLVLSHPPITCTDVDEDPQTADAFVSEIDNRAGQFKCKENLNGDHFLGIALDTSDGPSNVKNSSNNKAKPNSSDVKIEAQESLTVDSFVSTQLCNSKATQISADQPDKLIDDNTSQVTNDKAAQLSRDRTSQLFEDNVARLGEDNTALQSGDNAVNLDVGLASVPVRKNMSNHNISWSEKAQTVVGKLASQVSNLTWDSSTEQIDGSHEGSPKLTDESPRSLFSPLRIPGNQLSSLINYTSSFFRGPGSADKDSSSGIPSSMSDSSSGYTYLPSASPFRLQLKSEFTKEDISRALGPDPRGFLSRSDSHYFKESPLYLQIRRGIQKNVKIYQPRAFDHWNSGHLQNEYWFVVPRDMGDKLYNFLMTWQPDAYGDEEETEPRGKCFYDIRNVDNLSQSKAVGSTCDGSQEDFFVLEDHFKESEKTWEILSKEEVYGAEKKQTMYRQDTIDESNIPELIGPTVIIKSEYIRFILQSIPRNMSVGYNWELAYATHKHGYSLQNLYMRTENAVDSPVLLFIMDTHGTVFGAYLSNTIRQNDTFYGSGATFLFTFYPQYKKFPWRGENQFFMHGTKDFFAVGSGEGVFGLWMDGDLNKGRSRQCSTFLNDVLAMNEDFTIQQLEVWRFVDSSLC